MTGLDGRLSRLNENRLLVAVGGTEPEGWEAPDSGLPTLGVGDCEVSGTKPMDEKKIRGREEHRSSRRRG